MKLSTGLVLTSILFLVLLISLPVGATLKPRGIPPQLKPGSGTSSYLRLRTPGSVSDIWARANGPYGGWNNSLLAGPGGQLFAGMQDGGVYRSTDNGTSWASTAMYDGTALALAADSAGRLFTATYYGLYFSTDDGASWTLSDSTLAYRLISSFAVDKYDNIFVGTESAGVYESTDHGTSWNQTSLSGIYVYSLTIDSKGDLLAGSAGGIYKSTDDGSTWSQAFQISDEVLSMTVSHNHMIFAGTASNGVYVNSGSDTTWNQMNSGLGDLDVVSLAADSSGSVFAGTSLGQFMSIDDGQSWVRTDSALAQEFVNSIVVDPSGSVFAGTSARVCRSTDGGTDWTEADSGITASAVSSVSAAPWGSVFAATTSAGIFKYSSLGQNWSGIGPFYAMNNYVYDVMATPSGQVFAGTGVRGTYVSSDEGTTWSDIFLPAPTSNIVYSLAVSPSGDVFAGSDLGGVYEWSNQSGSWIQKGVTGNDISCLAIDSSGLIYAGTVGGTVWLSTDDGTSWNSLMGLGVLNGVNSLAADFAGNIYAATDSGVVLSTDRGKDWTACGLTKNYIYSVSINSSGYIFAGTWREGAFRSTDGGRTWAQFNTGLLNGMVDAFASDASGRLYAGTDGGGVYYTAVTASPHPAPSVIAPREISQQPRLTTFVWSHTRVASDFHFQVATTPDVDSTGAFLETNVVLDTSLADTSIKLPLPLAAYKSYYWHVAAVDTVGVSPFCAASKFTTGSGLDGTTETPTVPSKFELDQNYPNPFNPTTAISYQLSALSHVTLKVYDVLGREIVTLVDGEENGGVYKVNFNASAYASGLYFYRLRAESNDGRSFTSVKKMLLVK